MCVRAPSDRWARRGALLVEDALHTASLPASDGSRVVLIRRLELGSIDGEGSSASVALTVERLLEAMGASAIHGSRREARDAPVVFFEDDVEPIVTLAGLVVEGSPATDAWYWPLVAPGWQPGIPPEESLSRLLGASLGTSVGAYGMVRLVEALEASRRLSPLIDALDPGYVSTIVSSLGWEQRASPRPPRVALLSPSPHGVVRTVARFAPSTDPVVLRWLACTLLASRRPEMLGHPELGALAQRVVFDARTMALDVPVDGEEPEAEEREPHDVRAPQGPAAAGDAVEGAGGRGGGTAPAGDVGGGVAPPRGGDESTSAVPGSAVTAGDVHAPDSHLWWRDGGDDVPSTVVDGSPPTAPGDDPPHATARHGWGEATPFAGTLLLVQVMRILGVGETVAEAPDRLARDWPRAALCLIARRLGVPPDDPTLRSVAPRGGKPPSVSRLDRNVTARLIRSMRAFMREQVGVGLRELVARPGRIAATRTHVDAFFTMAQVDLRIRLAGVDVNPGWVSWLGRVVSYHYLDTSEEEGS